MELSLTDFMNRQFGTGQSSFAAKSDYTKKLATAGVIRWADGQKYAVESHVSAGLFENREDRKFNPKTKRRDGDKFNQIYILTPEAEKLLLGHVDKAGAAPSAPAVEPERPQTVYMPFRDWCASLKYKLDDYLKYLQKIGAANPNDPHFYNKCKYFRTKTIIVHGRTINYLEIDINAPLIKE